MRVRAELSKAAVHALGPALLARRRVGGLLWLHKLHANAPLSLQSVDREGKNTLFYISSYHLNLLRNVASACLGLNSAASHTSHSLSMACWPQG